MVRAGVWVRFRRGYYAFADEWSALDAIGRRLEDVRTILLTHIHLDHAGAAGALGTDWGRGAGMPALGV